MKQIMFVLQSALIVTCTLFIGCTQRSLTHLSAAKERVIAYYESGAYTSELNRLVDNAIDYFQCIPKTDNATIIFDVDDTVLSDYPDLKSISFGYIPKLSHQWVLEADLPAIKPVKKLYDYLVGRGFQIIFLTGRHHDEYEPTIKNLIREGFNTFEKLITRSPEEKKLTARTYKSARRKQLTQQGYAIVGCIGDQWSDLKGGNCGYTLKLPNYHYTIK